MPRKPRPAGDALRYAILTGANLTGTAATLTNLSSTDLSSAKLTGADLTASELSSADLRGATLTGAILKDADLSGARNLTQTQLISACGTANTKLPEGLTPEAMPWEPSTLISRQPQKNHPGKSA